MRPLTLAELLLHDVHEGRIVPRPERLNAAQAIPLAQFTLPASVVKRHDAQHVLAAAQKRARRNAKRAAAAAGQQR